MNQPIELAQAHQFVFEQPSERIELNRVVLAQDFGGGGELNRIGSSGIISEPGFDLFEPTGGNYARRRRRSRPRCVACLCMRSWLRCPRLRPQQITRQSRTIIGRRADDLPGRKSCLHSGSRPKWPAWRNRRRLSPSAWATFCTAQLLSRETNTRYRVVEQIDSCSRREPSAACERSEGPPMSNREADQAKRTKGHGDNKDRTLSTSR